MLLKRPVSRVVHEQNRPTCRQAETRWWAQDRKTRTRTVVLTITITIRPYVVLTSGPTTLARVVLVTRPLATVANYLSAAIPASRRTPRIKVSPSLLAEDKAMRYLTAIATCCVIKRFSFMQFSLWKKYYLWELFDGRIVCASVKKSALY